LVAGCAELAADLEGRMSAHDHIIGVFTTFPAITQSTRWQAVLNHAPVTTLDLIRRAAHLRILRLLLHDQPSPFLVMKGPALAEIAYPSPLQRQSLDLDILVAPDQVHDWIDHLKGVGFESDTDDLRPHAMNQIALTSPLGIVELHWALALPPIRTPSFTDLLEDAQSVMIGDLEILTLGPLDGAVHLCLHFHQHLGDPSIMMDLALWIGALELSSEEVATRSCDWGLGQIAELPLYMIGILGCAPPINSPLVLASLGDLLLEEFRAGRSLEGEELEGYIFQLLSMTLLPNWWRPVVHRLFLGPHRVGNLLGKRIWFSQKLQ